MQQQENMFYLILQKKAMRDDNGNVLGVLGIGHDVTERKQREEELKN